MMEKWAKSTWLGAAVSGVLSFIAICHFNFILSWVCYVPLFIAVSATTTQGVVKKGLVFALVFSLLAFSWMISGAERFTGNSIFYGLGIFLIATVLYSLFCALLFFTISMLVKKGVGITAVCINSILVASVFCLAEALWRMVSTGFPFFDFHSGNGLASNIFTIQPASVFGVHILTFIVVMVNYLIAMFTINRLWAKWYIPVTVIAVYFLAGFFLLTEFNNRPNASKTISVAILAENILPDIKWDDQNGNRLVQQILDLNHSAVKEKPQIALWSESAIPWTYDKEDDLLKEVLKITDPAGITHVLGINTAYEENEVFNSAYCISPGGAVAGRYDKQYLLALIEQPLNGWLIPFLSSSGYVVKEDTLHSKPLSTVYGRAGILICNEAAIPGAAARQVKQGAQFLMNLSNDGWFNDTYIVKSHFMYARLRAVESRKDLAINSNNGYSGLVKASGKIEAQQKSDMPFVKMVTIQPNNILTIASSSPDLFVYCCVAWIAMMTGIGLLNKRKIKSGGFAFQGGFPLNREKNE